MRSENLRSAIQILAVVLLSFAFAPRSAQAQTFTKLIDFVQGGAFNPNGGIIEDPDGNLYLTTQWGNAVQGVSGMVYKTDESGGGVGGFYGFTGGVDGGDPQAGLFRDADGDLYGTANGGGDPNCGCGTVFKLDSKSHLTVLHAFTGGSDGAFPVSKLVSINGVLYGTTWSGGTGCTTNTNIGCGVIFKVTKSGKETVLYRFTGMSDGSNPLSMIRDSAGNLYGVTWQGTVNAGTIFKLDPTGKFTVLYAFTGGADGGNPQGRLIRDVNGNIHGTAYAGGDLGCTTISVGPGCGVVFRLSATGNYKVLHRFTTLAGGQSPAGGLLDVDGALYGTTYYGGSGCYFGWGCGVVYEIDSHGKYSVLYAFNGGDGMFPTGELMLGNNGNIYGTTTFGGGGCDECGTMFAITP